MKNLEPLACRIHDAVVVSGTEADQEMSHAWYQSQAIREPCPACEAIEEVLREDESRKDRGMLLVCSMMMVIAYVVGYLTPALLLPWLRGEF